MKKLVKAAIIGLLAASVIGIAGCGGSSGSKSSAPAASSVSQGALLQKIKSDGKLVVGTASGYPPFEFLDTSSQDQKKIDGIDMYLAQAVADKLGVKLEVQDMNFQALLSSLAAEKVDIAIAGISSTPERQKTLDFSNPYLNDKNLLIVRKEDAGKYHQLSDFNGKKIACQKSTTQEQMAKTEIQGAQVVSLTKIGDALLELKQGKVDAVPAEETVGGLYLATNDDLVSSGVYFKEKGEKAVAVPKGNPDLVNIINEVIKENQQNGNMQKWIDESTKKAAENAQQ